MRFAIGRCGLCVVSVALAAMAVNVSCALGDSPWWHLQSGARPSYLPPASEEGGTVIPGKGEIIVTASNLGNLPTSGVVTVTDRLPSGLQAVGIEANDNSALAGDNEELKCELSTLTCRLEGTFENEHTGETLPNTVVPFVPIEIRIRVKVLPGAQVCEPNSAACGENEVSVSGGGAPSVSVRRPVTVSEKPVPFGVESYELTPEEEGGTPTTQAGKHPFQVTGSLTLNQTAGTGSGKGYQAHPVALAKDLAGLLPPGLVGNPTPFPVCKLALFYVAACPQQTVLGVAMVAVAEPTLHQMIKLVDPIVNLEPAHGEPARFGFIAAGTPVILDTSVRSGRDYGITLGSSDIPQIAAFLSYNLTFWGVPGASSHDTTRGIGCLEELHHQTLREILGEGDLPCTPLEEAHPPPFLSMPTSCGIPPHTVAEGDSWVEQKPEGQRPVYAETVAMPALVGCNRLQFEPSIKVTPDGTAGSTPTGMNVDVHVDQQSVLNGTSLSEATVKDTTVALPEGVALNPSGADGLEACSEGLVGYQGSKEFETSPGVVRPAFTPKLPGSFGSSEVFQPGLDFCSNASKIGTVKIKTPLLPNPLEGALYLATQESNPFGSLVAMYIVAEDPVSGTLVKIPGAVHISEAGQLVATFENTPPVPFEDLEAHFFGGERAPLAAPARCGAYTTSASFLPWAAEPSDEAADTATASSTFEISSGPHGAACPGASLPFEPSLTAGMTSIQAGGFSPFTMTMSRPDGQQHLQAIQLKMPPGLSGILKGVELCPEPRADEGTCGANSQIGETIVSVGVGGQPFSVKGGRVYLTGPYKGAPFGLSIVNPAKAGPFDLEDTQAKHPACDCLVVRAKIEVNPESAQLTITSDNEGPYKIPTAIEGIPLEIQHVNVTVNRPGFTFNPTDCEKLAVTGTLSSTEGGSEALSVPFQATNCAVLAFKPQLSASIPAKATKADGTSFTVKLGYPAGPYDANIARVKVELPKALPSRLTTLQKACAAAVFEANPAACPAASIVGHAVATTPLVPVDLAGPAYFVSHGGEAFPSLIVVLQGYGVTIHLVGSTFINKAGVTSSTFKTVPDAPVGTFELTLPTGPYSALTASGNPCKQKLTMPTEFVGQNGALIDTTTKIAVTGCPKAKKAKRHTAKHKRAAHARKKRK
jgi:hypothetical protein